MNYDVGDHSIVIYFRSSFQHLQRKIPLFLLSIILLLPHLPDCEMTTTFWLAHPPSIIAVVSCHPDFLTLGSFDFVPLGLSRLVSHGFGACVLSAFAQTT